MEGIFPERDQYGNLLTGKRALRANQPVAGGWRAGFDSWCGDWKERSLSHCFVGRNYQSTQVCDQCNAVKPFSRTPPDMLPLLFTDFRADAPWVATIRTHESYLRTTPRDQISPWVGVPGFFLSRVRWDTAHTILLGTGKDLCASVLFDFVAQPEKNILHVLVNRCPFWVEQLGSTAVRQHA